MSEATTAAAATVQIVTSPQEKEGLAQRLAQLSSSTEMKSYGIEQWQFLLDAGDVTPLICVGVNDNRQEEQEVPLLGCLLHIRYGPHAAYGMMLVSPNARGQGLARKLLDAAMIQLPGNLKLLATCGEMGVPLYKKMGYRRVGTVRKLAVEFDKLKNPMPLMAAQTTLDIQIQHNSPLPVLDKVLALDAQATGMDRSKTLQAIQGYPYVTTATIMDQGELTIAALVTRHTGSSSIKVGPILGHAAHAPTLLHSIRDHYLATNTSSVVKEMTMIVWDHNSLVDTLQQYAGFQTVFELGAMTWDGVPLPGERDLYLGLIHPTLG